MSSEWPQSVSIGTHDRMASWSPDRPRVVTGVRFSKPTKLLEVRQAQIIRAITSTELTRGVENIQMLHDVSALSWSLNPPVELKVGEVLQIRISKVPGGVTVDLELEST